ncbi:MAG: hypothetical protein LBK22_10775 [Tannerella sp.]|jgi:hypothetical protein|nr:hypothetical protein [Tannerella sp.]
MKNYFIGKNVFVLFAALLASVLLFVNCGESNEPEPETEPDDLVLKGELAGEKTLLAGKTYSLVGGYQVKNGGNLIIEAGVTVIATRTIDGQPDYIIIEQGGKINVKGTKQNPVVMTSGKEEAGAWGGLHICGKAPVNLSSGRGLSEIGDAPFGGSEPDDNSGSLRYVRLEYTGFAFSETKESNGVTFYGVGAGTTVEYVQVYKGADDGFEWFGGTVNAKYLVSTNSEDDSFDWTDGWIGKGQFWVARQDPAAPGSDGTANGDCLIEADNREDNFANRPVSNPTLSNLTLIGNHDTNSQKRGIRLRAGTRVKLYNTLVVGKPNSLTTATAETEQSFLDGASLVEHLWVDNGFTYEGGADLALETKTGNAVNQKIEFKNGFVGTVEGGADLSATDPFFTKATYKGAVSESDDWTAGWVK